MASSKYGRWKLLRGLGGGGQSDVFAVEDGSGELLGSFALKRLRDLSRLDRFRREIAALQSLSHPNIVRVVDYRIPEKGGEDTPAYLVMPLASEGDANRRLPLFKDSIEAVTTVSLQIALALKAAHAANVIHRDIKPGNILFPSVGLDIWLADFGICRIESDETPTPDGAVMGPRRFSAPEIEAGNATEVSHTVDIYSLGQLIYFLLSGGRVFHREDVLGSIHDLHFGAGQRPLMLRLLLAKMVSPKATRIDDIDYIISSLRRIRNWEVEASVSILDDRTREAIQVLRRQVLEAGARKSQNEQTVAEREATVEAAKTGLLALIKAELTEAVAALNDGQELNAELREHPMNQTPVALGARTIGGITLSVGAVTHPEVTRRLNIFVSRDAGVGVLISSDFSAKGPGKGEPTYFRSDRGMVLMQGATPGSATRKDLASRVVTTAHSWTDSTDAIRQYLGDRFVDLLEWVGEVQGKVR